MRVAGGGGEEGEEPGLNLSGDDVEGVGAIGGGAYLEAGHFTLELPGVAVDVEDSVAEEVAEEGGELFAFRVVVEVSFEDVAEVEGVGGDDGGGGGGAAEEEGEGGGEGE